MKWTGGCWSARGALLSLSCPTFLACLSSSLWRDRLMHINRDFQLQCGEFAGFLSCFGAFLWLELKWSKLLVQPPQHVVICAHRCSNLSFLPTNCKCFWTCISSFHLLCCCFMSCQSKLTTYTGTYEWWKVIPHKTNSPCFVESLHTKIFNQLSKSVNQISCISLSLFPENVSHAWIPWTLNREAYMNQEHGVNHFNNTVRGDAGRKGTKQGKRPKRLSTYTESWWNDNCGLLSIPPLNGSGWSKMHPNLGRTIVNSIIQTFCL